MGLCSGGRDPIEDCDGGTGHPETSEIIGSWGQGGLLDHSA